MKAVSFLSLLAASSLGLAQDKPFIDGMLPDSGGSGIPEVKIPEAAKGGAIAAMLAVPPKYLGGILEITGNGGEPNPQEWVLQAWNTEDPGTVHKLTVREDQFVSDALSVNLFEAERREINIPLQDVRVDSAGAFRIADSYASANGKALGRVNFILTVRAKHTPPIWTLECFDAKGSALGKLEIEATSGAVTASAGFKVRPR